MQRLGTWNLPLPRGQGFWYRDPDGRKVEDRETLQRIARLAIPPAWTDVWISTDPDGHIQATGRDQRRRKQYRYHPRWTSHRDDVPRVTQAWAEGELARQLASVKGRMRKLPEGLDEDEAIVLRWLETPKPSGRKV